MSFESVVFKGVKDVEIGLEDAVKIFTKASTEAPAAVVALTAFAGAVDKAQSDVVSDVASPTTITLTLPTTVSDFKTIWPDAKALLASIGIK